MPSNKQNENNLSQKEQTLGSLFRDWSEIYLRQYPCSMDKIKLIRSIRICKTPALGGMKYECKACGATHFTYKSCGNSHCPICQGMKRLGWQYKLSSRMYQIPYSHITFTMPHELNGLAKHYPRLIYNILFWSAWETINRISKDPRNIGARSGMISVLHTWGSDMKYHVHLHCLVSFGGLDESYDWVWPKRKKYIASYKEICKVYRGIFLELLRKVYGAGKIEFRQTYGYYANLLKDKRWVVNQQPATANTKTIEEYLAKYICRSAISTKRLSYIKSKNEVVVSYKDYAKQTKGKAAPYRYKTIDPLSAIHQIIMHKLPPYFHKSRYYGIHSTSRQKKIEKHLDKRLKRNKSTIKKFFEILRSLLGLEEHNTPECRKCGSNKLIQTSILSDHHWCKKNIKYYGKKRAPPWKRPHIKVA